MLNKDSIIIDTSFFIALAKSDDLHHSQAKKLAKTHAKKTWVSTWPVLTELSHILSSKSFLLLLQEQQQGLFNIFSLSEDHIPQIVALKAKYSDQDVDLADISLVLLAEQLEHGSILTFDIKDFSFLRWHNTHRFENLCK